MSKSTQSQIPAFFLLLVLTYYHDKLFIMINLSEKNKILFFFKSKKTNIQNWTIVYNTLTNKIG